MTEPTNYFNVSFNPNGKHVISCFDLPEEFDAAILPEVLAQLQWISDAVKRLS